MFLLLHHTVCKRGGERWAEHTPNPSWIQVQGKISIQWKISGSPHTEIRKLPKHLVFIQMIQRWFPVYIYSLLFVHMHVFLSKTKIAGRNKRANVQRIPCFALDYTSKLDIFGFWTARRMKEKYICRRHLGFRELGWPLFYSKTGNVR